MISSDFRLSTWLSETYAGGLHGLKYLRYHYFCRDCWLSTVRTQRLRAIA